MPVTVTRTYNIKTKEGQTIILSEDEAQKMEADADVLFVCDSPRCAARHATPEPMQHSWNETEVRKDIQKQYEVNKWIMLGPGRIACGQQCAKDFYTYAYQPPENPAEAIKRQKEELEKLNPHLRANVTGTEQQPAPTLSGSVQTPVKTDGDYPYLVNPDVPNAVPMPAEEVKTLCQESPEGYGHGV